MSACDELYLRIRRLLEAGKRGQAVDELLRLGYAEAHARTQVEAVLQIIYDDNRRAIERGRRSEMEYYEQRPHARRADRRNSGPHQNPARR